MQGYSSHSFRLKATRNSNCRYGIPGSPLTSRRIILFVIQSYFPPHPPKGRHKPWNVGCSSRGNNFIIIWWRWRGSAMPFSKYAIRNSFFTPCNPGCTLFGLEFSWAFCIIKLPASSAVLLDCSGQKKFTPPCRSTCSSLANLFLPFPLISPTLFSLKTSFLLSLDLPRGVRATFMNCEKH